MTRLSLRLLPLLCLFGMVVVPISEASPSDAYSRAEAVRALAAAEAALSGPRTLAAGGAGEVDVTFALRDLAVALPALDRADRRLAREILARPTESKDREYFGPEATGSPICSASICVHWTDKQANAPVDQAFIDEVIAATELSVVVENDTLGWRAAKSDGKRGARNGVGVGGQVDVYITDLGRNLFGFASPDPGQKGPKQFAYLVLDNNYVGFPSPPIDSMKVTVAHEYNHILQFNYDLFQDLWMFESTATWAEQQVYPDLNDYLNYVPAFARFPQIPMTGKEIKIYAEAVWNHWLSSRYGTDVIRQAWAGSLAANPPSFAPAAYEAAIRDNGGRSFSREFGDFAAATAEWNSSLAFPDAAIYPDMKRRGTLGAKSEEIVLDNTSYQLFDVKPKGAAATLKVKAQPGTRSTIALVGRIGPIDGGAVTVRSIHLAQGGKGTVELESAAGFDRVTAVVINADARRAGKRGYRSNDSKYTATLTG